MRGSGGEEAARFHRLPMRMEQSCTYPSSMHRNVFSKNFSLLVEDSGRNRHGSERIPNDGRHRGRRRSRRVLRIHYNIREIRVDSGALHDEQELYAIRRVGRRSRFKFG